jgi:hypothetical protein
MCVPERVPQDAWLLDPITCRSKHSVVEVFELSGVPVGVVNRALSRNS